MVKRRAMLLYPAGLNICTKKVRDVHKLRPNPWEFTPSPASSSVLNPHPTLPSPVPLLFYSPGRSTWLQNAVRHIPLSIKAQSDALDQNEQWHPFHYGSKTGQRKQERKACRYQLPLLHTTVSLSPSQAEVH